MTTVARYNLSLDFSEMEGGTAGERSRKKDKTKMKRKKAAERPRLFIIGLDQEHEMVECQLETAKNNKVNFRFNCQEDAPGEVANYLVSPSAICTVAPMSYHTSSNLPSHIIPD